MKADEFSKIAKEFHALEKFVEENDRRRREEEKEEEEFYDMLGPKLKNPPPGMVVSFPRLIPDSLLQLIRKRDNIGLIFLSQLPAADQVKPMFQYAIARPRAFENTQR